MPNQAPTTFRDLRQAFRIAWSVSPLGLRQGARDALMRELAASRREYAAMASERDHYKRAACTIEHEVEQILGKALGYPVMGPELFEDGKPNGDVCVGDHVAQSLAAEAAQRIAESR